MQYEEVMDRLHSLSDPEAVAGMARFGINPDNTLGVSVPNLRKLAKTIGKNHGLAQKIWSSGVHEARILASMVDEPAKVTQEQMERWALEFDSWDVCDQCCMNLLDKTQCAFEKALEWSGREEEFVKRAGFALMACLAVHDKKAADERFLAFLPAIKREAVDQRNYVRKAVNWALRQIGKRNLALNWAAIDTAREIQQIDSKAARWIASDALRELSKGQIQKQRLASGGWYTVGAGNRTDGGARMNTQGSICRIGVFYDGPYFSIAQKHYYYDQKMGWLGFQPFHAFIEHFVSTKEQSFISYKVVYASWHQGLHTAKDASEGQLRFDRNRYQDLLHAGIEAKFLSWSRTQGEKGVDVALAVDALRIGFDGKIDIAVLVSGDGDFVPLVRMLNKQGIRVVAAYFEFTDRKDGRSFINERLLNACNYSVNISGLEGDQEFKAESKSLFRTTDEWKDNELVQEPDGVGSDEKV